VRGEEGTGDLRDVVDIIIPMTLGDSVAAIIDRANVYDELQNVILV